MASAKILKPMIQEGLGLDCACGYLTNGKKDFFWEKSAY